MTPAILEYLQLEIDHLRVHVSDLQNGERTPKETTLILQCLERRAEHVAFLSRAIKTFKEIETAD